MCLNSFRLELRFLRGLGGGPSGWMGIRWGSVTSRTHMQSGSTGLKKGKTGDNGNTPQNKCRAVKFLLPEKPAGRRFSPVSMCAVHVFVAAVRLKLH